VIHPKSVPILFHALVETLKISWPTVVESRRGSVSRTVCDERLRSWSRALLGRVQAEVHLEGGEHLKSMKGPFIFVGNHESLYDIPVLFSLLPLSFRMAAKKELYSTPIWGKALSASGFVEIDRSHPDAAYSALHAAGEKMRAESLSLFIAPEGTRSPDGRLGAFKKGAFDLARVTDLPLIPVAIMGTRGIHQKGSGEVHIGRSVTVRLLSPIAAASIDDLAKAADHTRSIIQEALTSPPLPLPERPGTLTS
jgi:1-acyl-sn-glycerol-3-phosphate acyltransferase